MKKDSAAKVLYETAQPRGELCHEKYFSKGSRFSWRFEVTVLSDCFFFCVEDYMSFDTFLTKYVHFLLYYSVIECQRDIAAPFLSISCHCVRAVIIGRLSDICCDVSDITTMHYTMARHWAAH